MSRYPAYAALKIREGTQINESANTHLLRRHAIDSWGSAVQNRYCTVLLEPVTAAALGESKSKH